MTSSNKGYVKVLQITDTHLFSDDEQEIFGVKSNKQLNKCLDHLISSDLNNTDYIFLTGDVSQDETIKSYEIIAEKLSSLNIPVYWIPGNHDDQNIMSGVFKQHRNFFHERSLSFPGWHIIFMHSNSPGVPEGYFLEEEIRALSKEIQSCKNDVKIGIVMHHHPYPVGTPLMDKYILQNNIDFWNIIEHTRVSLVICGHVHGDYSYHYKNIQIEASPATCFQLPKKTTELKISPEIGYKIHYFKLNDYSSKAIIL